MKKRLGYLLSHGKGMSEAQTIRILLVDDNEDYFVLTRYLLAEIDSLLYSLEWAREYEEAWEKIQENRFDVYLVDYRLGARNGIELIRQSAQQGFSGPFILLTGQEDREIDLEAMKAGAMDYLVKGEFDSSVLERSIRYAMEQVKVLKALGQSEARYRKLVEQIPAVTYICAPFSRGQMSYLSPQISLLSGMNPQDYLNSSDLWASEIHPEDRERVLSELQGMGIQKKIYHLEYRILNNKKQTVWVRDEGILIQDEQEKPLFFQGVITDMTDRKQRESDLLVRNNAVETSISGIIFTDLLGNITYANQSFLKMWGYQTPEEILEKPVVGLSRNPETFSFILNALYDVGNWIGEKTVHRSSGDSFESQILANMLKDEKDQPVCLMFFFLDISERKKVEEEVRRLSRAVDQSQSTILITNVAGQIIYVNPSFEAITGYRKEEALGKNPRFLKSGYHTREEYRQLWEMILRGTTWHGELKNRKKNGDFYWEDTIISPVFSDDGKIMNFVAVKQDITQKKAVEEALKASEERYRLLFNSGNDAIFVNLLRDDGFPGIFLEVNEIACRALGYSRKEMLGKKFHEILEVSSDELQKKIREKMNSSQYAIFESTLLSRDQRKIPVEMNSHLFHFNGQRALLSIARDISERVQAKQQEQLLIQQSKLAAMGEMIGAIAHQWRQPLNGLSILVQDLEDALAFGELNEDYIRNTVQSALFQIHFMSRTIDDFRNFFKPSKSKEPFNLLAAVQETLFLITAQLKNNDIGVSLKCDYPACPLTGDQRFSETEGLEISSCKSCIFRVIGYPNEFKQVVLNLIENAKEAILESRQRKILPALGKGEIEMILKGEKHKLILEICDNGGGIPENVMPRIFEPYFTTKEEGKGTGIGLYMSKVIIENNMGGRLMVSNGTKGAVFSIELDSFYESNGERAWI